MMTIRHDAARAALRPGGRAVLGPAALAALRPAALPALRLVALAALVALPPAAAVAQQQDTLPPIVPATALPLASPTGAADLALLVHWLDTDATELYGFAFRARARRMPLNVQLGYGQPRGPIGGRWVLALSVDGARPIVQRPAGMLAGGIGAQLLYNRRADDLNLRLPLLLRAETTLQLADRVLLSPVAAGGAALGLARVDDWSEYGGVFGEAGLRLSVHGAWAQGGVGLDRRVLGDDDASSDPRFVVRFGFVPQRPAR